jgi:4-hydroxybenzoate polyprenyltransferase
MGIQEANSTPQKSGDKKAAEAAYSLHVLFILLSLLLWLFGKTPELLQFIHCSGGVRQAIVTDS